MCEEILPLPPSPRSGQAPRNFNSERAEKTKPGNIRFDKRSRSAYPFGSLSVVIANVLQSGHRAKRVVEHGKDVFLCA